MADHCHNTPGLPGESPAENELTFKERFMRLSPDGQARVRKLIAQMLYEQHAEDLARTGGEA